MNFFDRIPSFTCIFWTPVKILQDFNGFGAKETKDLNKNFLINVMIRRRNCQQGFLYNLLDLMVHRFIRDGDMRWDERFFPTNEFVG